MNFVDGEPWLLHLMKCCVAFREENDAADGYVEGHFGISVNNRQSLRLHLGRICLLKLLFRYNTTLFLLFFGEVAGGFGE